MALSPEEQQKLLQLTQARNAMLDEQIQKQIETLRLQGEEVSRASEAQKLRAARIAQFKEELTLRRASKAELANIIAQGEAELRDAEKKGTLGAELLQQKREELARKRLILKADQAINKEYAQQLSSQMRLLQQVERRISATQQEALKLNSITTSLASLVGLGKEFGGTITGQVVVGLETAFNLVATRGIGGFKALGNALASALSPSKIAGAIVGVSEQVMGMQDRMMTNFVRLTGGNQQFTQTVLDSSNALRNMGISFDQTDRIAASLYDNMVQFRRASRESRQEMVTFVGILNEFGVDAGTAARTMNTFTQVVGQTGPQAQRATSGLIGLAQQLNLNVNAVLTDFMNLSPQLAVHGSNMRRVFGELAAQAAASGASMQTLVSVAAQFDTFEGAATAIGRLNGILGGPYLNSIRMVYMTESQRNRAMVEALELSGRSWHSMSRLERIALANAAGFRDQAEAAKVFGTSLYVYDMQQAKARETARSQDELRQSAARAQSIWKQLQLTLYQLAISMAPLAAKIREILQWIIKKNEAMNGSLGVYALYTFAGFKLLGMLTKLGGAFSGVVGSLFSFTSLFRRTTPSNTLARFGTAAGGASVAVGGMTTPLFAVAAAIGSFGLAVSGIIYTLGKAAESFSNTSLSVNQLTILVGGLTASLISLGAAGPLSFIGLAALAGGLVSLTLAINAIDAMKLNSLVQFMQLVNTQASTTTSYLRAVGDEIKNLAMTVSTTPINFTVMTSGFEELNMAISKGISGARVFQNVLGTAIAVETDDVENVRQIVDQAVRYVNATVNARVNVIGAAARGAYVAPIQQAAAPAAQGPTQVSLFLDGEVFGRGVVKTWRETMTAKTITQ